MYTSKLTNILISVVASYNCKVGLSGGGGVAVYTVPYSSMTNGKEFYMLRRRDTVEHAVIAIGSSINEGVDLIFRRFDLFTHSLENWGGAYRRP